ncbi:hypothetical protein SERLA73DRAFT_132792 [Serpula lacrymans var. lacrymans S7.3]|uniref:Uncharacterized protein n=1 Tax=Serpula lacrymans var. lacrymans (strain S7.3) TaxID=936435 RepID=F8PPG2_SERL3|nr:hypothetical protein SERLA73DRAFT_132792 [Serpula lacrymans var. lacrymans S7.3]
MDTSAGPTGRLVLGISKLSGISIDDSEALLVTASSFASPVTELGVQKESTTVAGWGIQSFTVIEHMGTFDNGASVSARGSSPDRFSISRRLGLGNAAALWDSTT